MHEWAFQSHRSAQHHMAYLCMANATIQGRKKSIFRHNLFVTGERPKQSRFSNIGVPHQGNGERCSALATPLFAGLPLLLPS